MVKMLSVMLAVCALATANVQFQFPTPLPETAEPPSRHSLNGSDVTPYYLIGDVSFPPLRANYTGKAGRKKGATSYGRRSYLRVRSRYRNSHQRDASYEKYSNEYWIKRAIMMKYDRSTVPASRRLTTVPLYVGMSLYHILDTVTTAHV